MPCLSAERLFRAHCWLIAAATLAHVLSRIAFGWLGRESSITKALSFAEESSVPTVLSVAGLLAAAGAAGLIMAAAREQRDPLWRSWAFVLGCLLFLALDEGAALHDRLTFPIQGLLDLDGIFYIGWVLPYLALVVLCAVLLVPLALQLPRRTLLRLALAGALFVSCAMGLEMAESVLIQQGAGEGVALRDADLATLTKTPLMTVLITLEEMGEMLAVALALRALLLHLVLDRGVTVMSLTAAVRTPVQARSGLGRATTSPVGAARLGSLSSKGWRH
jgi:hypothetical protein